MYWVYMMKNKGDKLYVGITKNPEARVQYHNQKRGAGFTKNNPSFGIVFLEEYSILSAARKREIQIKKWRRDKKDFIIDRYRQRLPTKT